MSFNSKRFHKLFKEGSWIFAGQAAAIVGSLFGVRLITEILDPESYGKLALALTVATLVNQTILGPLSNGVTRFYAPAQSAGDLNGYLKAVKELVRFASLITLLIIVLIIISLIATQKFNWISITLASFVFALLSGYSSILAGIQNAARQRSIVAFHQGIEPTARFLIAAGLLLWIQDTTEVAMSGYALATLILVSSQIFFFRKNILKEITTEENPKFWKDQIWVYSWPFASWGIFSWAQTASDRWALGYFSSTSELGHYAVLFQLGYYPMSMATGLAMQFLAPIFYEKIGISNQESQNTISQLSRKITWVVLGLTFLGVVLVLFLHPLIFKIFVAKKYAAASYLLPWMLLSGGIFAAAQTIALNLMSLMKTSSMAIVKISTSILGVIFNFVGAYYYGLQGVVIAGIIFSTIYFIWMLIISKKSF
jgi:O-antigen/teichoic acid export membrane protein